MKTFKDYLEEGDRGLWDNIHAKQKRIKAGSGEHMRKPGSKGAPTAQAFKDANEEVMAEGKDDKIKQLRQDYADKLRWSKEAHDPAQQRQHNAGAFRIANHLKKQYGVDVTQGVAEGAPIVVMPRADRLKKAEPTKVRYQGDIVPPTQPPSTEKRGVKGRPGQRPMPKYESVEDIFDLIESVVEEMALLHNLDSEYIWEKFEQFSDEELLEYAVDAKGHKSSTGGLTQKGRDAYNATGANLKAPVTTPPSKLKAGSKAANRRKSFCARMGGMEGPMKKPNGEPSRKALALRKWNC